MKKLILILALTLCVLPAQAQFTSGGTVTPTITTVTETGTIPAGAKSLTFIFSSGFAGTLLGTAFAGGSDSTVSLTAPVGDTLTAVTYTVTAGSFRLIQIK